MVARECSSCLVGTFSRFRQSGRFRDTLRLTANKERLSQRGSSQSKQPSSQLVQRIMQLFPLDAGKAGWFEEEGDEGGGLILEPLWTSVSALKSICVQSNEGPSSVKLLVKH